MIRSDRSPLYRGRQAGALPGGPVVWCASYALPPMERDQAVAWCRFLAGLLGARPP